MGRKTKPTASRDSLKNKKSNITTSETPELPPDTPELPENSTPVPTENETEQTENTQEISESILPKQSSALNILSEQIVENYHGDLNEAQHGQFVGEGKAEFVSKNTYHGEFQEGCMHGTGVYTFEADNTTYTGDFFLNKLTGKGVINYKNEKAEYKGELLNGQRHGSGTMTAKNGAIYTGNWKNGKRHGVGSAIYPDGSRYNGEFVEDNRSGNGIQQFPNGNSYTGSWQNDKPEGKGVMRWEHELYEGGWSKGIPNGKGTYTWVQTVDENGVDLDVRVVGTEVIEKCLNNQYVGDFVDGRREGNGRFFYASGAIYSGEWKNNKKHGSGKYVFKSGRVFSGAFELDHMILEDEEDDNDAGLELPKSARTVRKTPDGYSKSSRPNTAHSSLHPATSDPQQDEVHAEAPGFTLDLNILLKFADNHANKNKHSIATNIVNLFVENLSIVKKVYNNYANLGLETTAKTSNAILTRLQYWQMLADLREHIFIPIPALDRCVAQNRQVISVHQPAEQFLFREFLTNICVLGKYVNSDLDLDEAIRKFVELIKRLDDSEILQTRPFFELGMNRYVGKLTMLYNHLNQFEQMKQVTVKTILVFLKAIQIVSDEENEKCESPTSTENPTETNEINEEKGENDKTNTPENNDQETDQEISEQKSEENTKESNRPSIFPISSTKALEMLNEIDIHLKITDGSYQLDRELCLLEVSNFFISLARFGLERGVEESGRKRTTSQCSDSNTLFKAIEQNEQQAKNNTNQTSRTWAWINEKIMVHVP